MPAKITKPRKFKVKKTPPPKPQPIALPTQTSSWKLLKKLSPAYSWPFIAVIAAHLIWGFNFIVAKLTLQEFPPHSLAFIRFTIALLLLSPFILTDHKRVKISKNDLPLLIIIGVLMITFNIAFFYAGLERTTVSSASALTMVIPMFSVLFGWWFLKEKVYISNLAGIALGLVGTILVIKLPSIILGTTLTPKALLGNFLIILASISWVIGAIISKKMIQKYSTLTITSVAFGVGAITFLIPALMEYLQNPVWPSKVTSLGLLGLIYISVASSICAYFLFEWGLGKLGVIKADLFQYIEPAVAASLGVIILSESIQPTFVIGAIMIGLGAYWATIGKPHHKHHKAHRI